MKSSECYELTFYLPDHRISLQKGKKLLRDLGFLSGEIAEFKNKRGKSLSVYPRNRRFEKKLKGFIEAGSWAPKKITFRKLKKSVWMNQWKKDLQIQQITSRLVLVPEWHRKRFRKSGNKRPLYLDPKSSFGAGTHESTRSVIRLMAQLEGQFQSFLDLGTGSGILSVAAWRLGAVRIEGIDREVSAARTATANLTRNGCQTARFRALPLSRFHPVRSFDLVVANLTTDVLLDYQERIRESVKRDGYLILSGVERVNWEEFQKRFSWKGFEKLKVLRGRHWAGFLVRRRGRVK